MNLVLYSLVVAIWGTTWIALKWQLGSVPIALSIGYRFALAALVLFALLAARRQLARPRGKALALVGAQGICLFCVNFVCFLKASATLQSGFIAVVFSTSTLWNALLARLVLKRHIAPRVIAGGALGLAGLALLFAPQLTARAADAATLAGLLWALGGTLCFSAGNLLSAALQARGLRPLQTNAWGMACGAALLFAYSLVSGTPWSYDASLRYSAALVYLAIPGSVVAFTAYLTLVGRLGPERAAYSTVLFPIVALNVSALLEGFQWNAGAVAGLVLVMLGNVLVFRRAAAPSAPPAATARV